LRLVALAALVLFAPALTNDVLIALSFTRFCVALLALPLATLIALALLALPLAALIALTLLALPLAALIALALLALPLAALIALPLLALTLRARLPLALLAFFLLPRRLFSLFNAVILFAAFFAARLHPSAAARLLNPQHRGRRPTRGAHRGRVYRRPSPYRPSKHSLVEGVVGEREGFNHGSGRSPDGSK
jgi:hypothetical protein